VQRRGKKKVEEQSAGPVGRVLRSKSTQSRPEDEDEDISRGDIDGEEATELVKGIRRKRQKVESDDVTNEAKPSSRRGRPATASRSTSDTKPPLPPTGSKKPAAVARRSARVNSNHDQDDESVGTAQSSRPRRQLGTPTRTTPRRNQGKKDVEYGSDDTSKSAISRRSSRLRKK
jgi:hypothetical protein